jgi:hypothetical protein
VSLTTHAKHTSGAILQVVSERPRDLREEDALLFGTAAILRRRHP